jgi:hypothetical protein
LEVASNTLESLVYDTAVKLEEEWANKHEFADDYKKIGEEVAILKVWIEDEAHGADVATLRKKRDGLSSMIRAVHQKEKEKREQERRAKEQKEREAKEAELKVIFWKLDI